MPAAFTEVRDSNMELLPDEVVRQAVGAVDKANAELRRLNLEVCLFFQFISVFDANRLVDLQQPRNPLPGIQGMQAPLRLV